MHALLIGGTRFIGRHTVDDLLAHGYDVTLFNRGTRESPFADHDDVGHVTGDRNERADLEAARDAVDPDVVIDFVAMAPTHAAVATEVFADVEAYVLVSTAAVYARTDVPYREDETPLHEYTEEHAPDDPADAMEVEVAGTYGPRKAECDRICFAAAEDGVNALVARPLYVFGPYDYTERYDYWIDRVANNDRVLVPGDGDGLAHQVYVEDVASALRVVAEEGTPGEAYNVGARRLLPIDDRLEAIADALDADVDLVHASDRDLDAHGLAKWDFPLVLPMPIVADTDKLAALGWETTDNETAIARTAEEHLESDRTGRENGPDRAVEERVIDALSE
ncbi:MAG: NAD-dependent epimerase/dehydratase family protein [Haloarculaceae archaeon]